MSCNVFLQSGVLASTPCSFLRTMLFKTCSPGRFACSNLHAFTPSRLHAFTPSRLHAFSRIAHCAAIGKKPVSNQTIANVSKALSCAHQRCGTCVLRIITDRTPMLSAALKAVPSLPRRTLPLRPPSQPLTWHHLAATWQCRFNLVSNLALNAGLHFSETGPGRTWQPRCTW